LSISLPDSGAEPTAGVERHLRAVFYVILDSNLPVSKQEVLDDFF